MKTTRHLFTASAIALALTVSPLAAAKQGENESKSNTALVGGATGATMGAIAAGPIGAVVGGVIGLMLGNGAQQDQEIASAKAALTESQRSLTALNQELVAWQQKAMTQTVSASEPVSQLLPELKTTVQFRTGKSQLEASYATQLNLVGELLKSFDDLAVHITGYTDPRGNDADNIALSQARASAVQQALLDQGVDADKISISGMGERGASNEQSLEQYFFDRKAVLMIAPRGKVLTAKQ
ncbi:sortase-associated OmpA-like protein PdsO [Alteromonas oceanisediminis]|uniref:sortase-associated OmpA-like protein PdsO n=1 Tax=Alteromonas oceanisediminis TaxID=2836180 RepID=UPI001BD9DCD8|nr:sortase-associated OmpA-like protein PdsO [Alteromonas oceanisediminis]MBT0587674.1 sortase-associated OmpA-like protein PdsO [Alteromonas oceanisediminis]